MSVVLVKSDGKTPGFLNNSGTHFIDNAGIEWGWMDRLLNPKEYTWALRQLQDHFTRQECVEDTTKYAPTYVTVSPHKVISGLDLPSAEELEIMSGRFGTPTIRHVGDARFTLEEIHQNGGLIPIKSDKVFKIQPRQSYHIQSGFIINIPIGYMGVLYPRKGMNQRGIELKGQIIHHTHDKEFTVYLKNTDLNEIAEVNLGEEVAQLAIVPIRTDFKII